MSYWAAHLRLMLKRVMAVVSLRVSMRGMPPQPHPPVAEGAWLRPRPARQSPDCRRGRVHRHASHRSKRVRLTAAAFPAQHIRSALSQGMAVGSAHRRLRRIPAGHRVRMRRGLPSPGSVGIPPSAGSAASRLPPSASPAVTASASCRRPSSRSAQPWHRERQSQVPDLRMVLHEGAEKECRIYE